MTVTETKKETMTVTMTDLKTMTETMTSVRSSLECGANLNLFHVDRHLSNNGLQDHDGIQDDDRLGDKDRVHDLDCPRTDHSRLGLYRDH